MLRPATLSDLAVVASWIATARECELWAGPRVVFPIDLAGLPAAIGFAEANAFSLTEDGQLVAFGQIVARGLDRVHLARIIVAPMQRRKGWGRILVTELVGKARRDWFERVSLNVDEANDPAIALYTKVGFREMGRPATEPAFPRSRYMEYQVIRDEA